MYCPDCDSHHPANGEVENGEAYKARCLGGDGWVPLEEG